MKLTPEEQFFYDHAGWSHDPKTETSETGRVRCAKRLAQVEAFAKRARIRYEWERDDITNESFNDERPFYKLWVCVARHGDQYVGSLGGIDFGRGGKPQGDPYKRVVEAELAIEAYHEHELADDAACRDIATV